MAHSRQYKCPRCQGYVDIELWLEESEETGESIAIEVYCPRCARRMRDNVHPTQYDLGRLVLELRNVG